MYAILSGGELLALCDEPRYIKINEKTGTYIRASAEDAIGIAVNGATYNLPGRSDIADAPQVVIRTGDVSEYVFRNKAQIKENEDSTSAAIVAVEDAICSMDESSEARLAALETALCELDAAVSS